jgi:hypothetical protein
MDDLQRIKQALTDPSGVAMDFYLEDTSSPQIISDIQALQREATLSTDAGVLKDRVMRALEGE